MILPIHTYGDSLLRRNSEDANIADKVNLTKLYNDMFDTLRASGGYSLSATQVGRLLNVFVIDTSSNIDEFFGYSGVFINCEIISKSASEKYGYEECLSFPNITGEVERHVWVEVSYYDSEFKKRTQKFDGLIARLIQHEYDHTKGILFDRRFKFSMKKSIVKTLLNIKNRKFKVPYKTAKHVEV